jgi:RNA polymerase sigma factor (sigma-70 family)
MATHRLSEALGLLRRAVAPSGGALTDGQLLARFVAARDEAAFAALVRRHGPMVLGVCRRVLRHAQDAEDAFQAAFLVLARKAASVVRGEAVGSWLYRVAYRTAREAGAKSARRRARERQVEVMPHPEVGPEEARDWLPLLDHELRRLPEQYRAAVVLCDLEGRSRREAARQLWLPEGTLSCRLARARTLLARRLARHRLALSGAALTAALAEACAAVPPALVGSTAEAALLVTVAPAAAAGVVSAHVVALTEGVLKAMLLVKLKTVTAVLCGLTALGLGTGGVLYQARARASDPTQAGPAAAALRPAGSAAAALDPDTRKLQQDREAERRAAERAREQELRAELEAARREALALRDEAERQRQRAEVERQRAEAVLALAKDQARLAEAKLAALEEAAKAHQAQAAAGAAGILRPTDGRDPRAKEANRAQDKPDMLKQLDDRRQKLLAELRVVEERLKKELDTLDAQRAELLGKQYTPPARPGTPGADKLDRILERMERMERRLERLERGPVPGGPGNKR